MSNPPAGYINLTDKETLYALRCVDAVGIGTADKIGIAERVLSSLATDGLLNYLYLMGTYEVTESGRKFMNRHGGGFKYGGTVGDLALGGG